MGVELSKIEIHCGGFSPDKPVALLVGFGPARKAARVWRFTHVLTDGLSLRIFADHENLPIAVDFRCPMGLPKQNPVSDLEETPGAAIQRLYSFAVSMIEQAQIREGERIIADALGLRDSRLVNLNLNRALRMRKPQPQTA